jgi:MarR family transcriptional regulator, organic hydroperoxide resistance regulator
MPAERDVDEVEQLLFQLSVQVIRTAREKGIAGLSITQLRILKRLAEKELRAGDLAIGLKVTPAAVTKQIDALESLGYVRRVSSRTDRRATVMEITLKGRQAWKRSEQLQHEAVRRALKPLDREEVAAMKKALKKLIDILPVAWPSGSG